MVSLLLTPNRVCRKPQTRKRGMLFSFLLETSVADGVLFGRQRSSDKWV